MPPKRTPRSGQAPPAETPSPAAAPARPAADSARPLLLLMLGMFFMQSTQSISTQSNAAFAAGIYGAENFAQIAAFCGQLVGCGAFVEFLANPTCGERAPLPYSTLNAVWKRTSTQLDFPGIL